jgi:hypothetical protein
VQFQTWGSTLTLMLDAAPAGAEAVNVFWGRRHRLERLASSVPAQAEEALLLGAGAFALMELAQYAINRVNLSGPGTEEDLERQGEERLHQFRAALRRFGDAGRVRASRLYIPARTAPSRFTAAFE